MMDSRQVQFCTLLGVGFLLFGGCDSRERPAAEGEAPRPSESQPSTSPSVALLEDVTAHTGIDFVHDKHETGDYRYPEIFGSGVGVLDYDNDGWYDLYFVQGGKMPGVEGGRVLSDQLYRNRGDGTFENVTTRAGINETGYGMGVVCGDYDNDGFTDIFVYNVGPDAMLRNNGDGTFTDVTQQAGVGDPRWGDGAAFLDYDNDGWLDLFVCNYVVWDPNHEKECTLRDTSKRDYCGPLVYQMEPDVLYRNNGNGAFTDVTAEVGVVDSIGTGMGVGVADFNDDGLLDIYVGNDVKPNQMWIQQPNHTFIDLANRLMVDVNAEGKAQSSMGITIEDFDLNGRFDLLLGHFNDDPNTLYLNHNRFFDDVSRPTQLAMSTLRHTTFGISVLDLFNDGAMQIYFGNGKGNLISKVVLPDKRQDPYSEDDLLLAWSYDELRFRNMTDEIAGVFDWEYITRGTAIADYDNDGDMDLVLSNNGGPARILRCNPPSDHHWLMVRAIGPDGRRDAYNTIIEIDVGGKTRRRQVYTACSYCSSSDPRVHFGLGQAEAVDRLTVHWLDGKQSVWQNVQANQFFVARYADAEALLADAPAESVRETTSGPAGSVRPRETRQP